MSPCPACSLCGALIAERKDRIVMPDRCPVSPASKDVRAVFFLLPVPDSNPEMQVPVACIDTIVAGHVRTRDTLVE